jgi:predicted RNA-binding protein with PIN domain
VAETRIVVLIDAFNVARSRWPHLSQRALVESCRSWAHAHGHLALVVFDGIPEERLSEPDPACEIVGTTGESADDWITRRAGELARRDEPYWLVTSDRELRRRAGAASRREIGGGSFLEHLGLKDPGR